jgi:eukaryotic-like serine/threonine-protein kinase
LNRKVAIKRMLGDAAKSQTAVKRFLTEAQSIAALNHFNIVQIHDYVRDKDGPFLIMEYVGGGSLLDKCREGALPLEEAVELTCQLCDGLEMAHDAGIIHRDIKPANVLLTTDGLPKLTDFGLARQDTGDTGQTMAGAVLGTLDFMSPRPSAPSCSPITPRLRKHQMDYRFPFAVRSCFLRVSSRVKTGHAFAG